MFDLSSHSRHIGPKVFLLKMNWNHECDVSLIEITVYPKHVPQVYNGCIEQWRGQIGKFENLNCFGFVSSSVKRSCWKSKSKKLLTKILLLMMMIDHKALKSSS